MVDEEEDKYSNGLKIRDTARVLGVHDNTVRNMMESGRLEWYYLNGQDGNRRVVASSIREFLLRNVTPDWCALCGSPISSHEVGTETILIGGKPHLRPIGWLCPVKPQQLKQH